MTGSGNGLGNILLCDLDHTFYDYETPNKLSHNRVAASLAEILDVNLAVVEDALKQWRDRTHKDLHGQGASHSRGIYYHHALEVLTWKSQPGLALEHEKLFWSTFLENMTLYEWAGEYLERLLHTWWRLGIITNLTQGVQFEKIERLDIAKYFEFVVTSEEVGVEKPDEKIFIHAMRKFVSEGEIPKDNFYMMGDSEWLDVEGARRAWIPNANILRKKEVWPKQVLENGITVFSSFRDL